MEIALVWSCYHIVFSAFEPKIKLFMHQNIVFIGGIHGVGKGTICSKIQQELGLRHLSASEVLRWKEVSPDLSNKLVKDIPDTQQRLIEGLENLTIPGERYILDGHFCLFDWDGRVNPVPIETFIKISPILLSIVVCDVKTVVNRLQARDSKHYNLDTVERMQKMELEHAKEVSKQLNIDLIKIDGSEADLIAKIKSL